VVRFADNTTGEVVKKKGRFTVLKATPAVQQVAEPPPPSTPDVPPAKNTVTTKKGRFTLTALSAQAQTTTPNRTGPIVQTVSDLAVPPTTLDLQPPVTIQKRGRFTVAVAGGAPFQAVAVQPSTQQIPPAMAGTPQPETATNGAPLPPHIVQQPVFVNAADFRPQSHFLQQPVYVTAPGDPNAAHHAAMSAQQQFYVAAPGDPNAAQHAAMSARQQFYVTAPGDPNTAQHGTMSTGQQFYVTAPGDPNTAHHAAMSAQQQFYVAAPGDPNAAQHAGMSAQQQFYVTAPGDPNTAQHAGMSARQQFYATASNAAQPLPTPAPAYPNGAMEMAPPPPSPSPSLSEDYDYRGMQQPVLQQRRKPAQKPVPRNPALGLAGQQPGLGKVLYFLDQMRSEVTDADKLLKKTLLEIKHLVRVMVSLPIRRIPNLTCHSLDCLEGQE
jgi:hypothetical protein